MIRAVVAALALLLLGVSPAHADPLQSGDYAYCAHVSAEMQKWDATKGVTISDCGLISGVAKALCAYWRQNGPYFQKAVDTVEPKYNWDATTAAIVIVYAVNDYCPEFTKYLPQQKPGQTPVAHDEPRDSIV